MSTSDVPGHKAENRDVLAAGCWAEHSDGSLLLVLSTEGKKVIYDVFDLSGAPFGPDTSTLHTGPRAVLETRDVRTLTDFQKLYSYVPGEDKKNGVSEHWTWHDKTPFPWQRVIDRGMELAKLKSVDPDGKLAVADAALTTASKVGTDASKVVGDADVAIYDSTDELISAARRVAKTLQLKGRPFKHEDASHQVATKGKKTAKATVLGTIKSALDALRGR